MKIDDDLIDILLMIAFMLLITFCGCNSVSKTIDTEPFEYKFQKTKEKNTVTKTDNRKKVTVRFDAVPFGQAMGILTQETLAPIVWSTTLDSTLASGTFNGVPLPAVLDVLARRAGASVTEIGGVFYLG
jgi:type II secretory pathway component HofQ